MTQLDRYPLNEVVLSWSGGIDSTAVLLSLLAKGYRVHAVTLDLYSHRRPAFAKREADARRLILDRLAPFINVHPAALSCDELDASALWQFAVPMTDEIPSRNKRMIDLLMAQRLIPNRLMNLALGEYVGADTWVVKGHVPLYDCDHRALSSYMLHEYGMDYRLISLQDFGESRYKHQRLGLGIDAWRELLDRADEEGKTPTAEEDGAGWIMGATTNCLLDSPQDCGRCYKCVERAVAFDMLGIPDPTEYLTHPLASSLAPFYRAQMQGFRIPEGAVLFDSTRDV